MDDTTYKKALGDLLNGMSEMTEEPPFSAFSQLTRIDCLQQGNDPIRLLNIFGQQMQCYRSWGKDFGNGHKVNGKDAEQNFKPDHQWYKRLDGYRESDFHPQRVVFGLPHNYLTDNVSGEKHDRRASPLLVHVHEYTPINYSLVSIVLRAKFLPAEEKIIAGNREVPQKIEWKLIDQFLDGYDGHRDDKTNTPYFPNKQTWFGG